MSLDKITDRWVKILSLVKVADTGTQSEFATKLGISVGTLQRDIKLINKMIKTQLFESVADPIVYSKKEKSYMIKKSKTNPKY